ncbi:MAG: hypothetical protein JNM18_09365 [Planctomycetaceae bacterium]|nr:hypothetical protein [Planctomycetaceae bacterium]
MSIHFLCPLGHPLVVPDDRAGKKGRCPICQQRVYVPQPQAASPGGPAHAAHDDVEIEAVPAPSTSRPGPMSELDRILAEELGLGSPAAPTSHAPPPHAVPPPVARTTPAHAPAIDAPPPPSAPTADVASPYAPATVDPKLTAEVPPPGAMRADKNLSSPGRPVREAVPPQRAVPAASATAPSPSRERVPFNLADPSLYTAPSTSAAPPVPTWPTGPLPATAPSAAPGASSPQPPALQSPWTTPATAAQPTYVPQAAALSPAVPQAANVPQATPTHAMRMPTAAQWPAEQATPDVRVFPPDQPLPWTVAPNETETHYELFVNEGWPQTTFLMVAAIVVAAGLGIIPLLSRWTGGVMPQWVTIVVGLTVVELAIALWLASLPDWSMLNLAGIATGLIAACYASGVAMVVTNASATTLPLDLFDVRNYAGGWCTGNALCWGMISYALVRAARQWKRNLRRLLRQV